MPACCGAGREPLKTPSAGPSEIPGTSRQLFFLVDRERGNPAQHVGELIVVSRRDLLQVVKHGRQPGRKFRFFLPGGPAGLLSSDHVSLLCP